MKTRLTQLIFLLVTLTLISSQCEVAMDYDNPLYLHNQSKHSINAYFNDNKDHIAIYPDTSISDFEDRIGLDIDSGKKISIAGGDALWENVFEVSVPNDTLSFFIFHTDTLSKYAWETIRDGYKILKRYDLSLKDLEVLEFTVPYPPSPKMKDMKMFPPYP